MFDIFIQNSKNITISTYKFIIAKMFIRNNILNKFFYTHTKYCVVGGGTGGLNVASHLLRSKVRPH
jgi:NADPH-dependent 2,4-dienoyl-CoA reductase/sulfur reductase-like enzyme